MTKHDKKQNKSSEIENKKDEQVLKNQINERYQNDVVNDKLINNKGIYTFNNQS